MTHTTLNRDPKDEILKAFRLFDGDETGNDYLSLQKILRGTISRIIRSVLVRLGTLDWVLSVSIVSLDGFLSAFGLKQWVAEAEVYVQHR